MSSRTSAPRDRARSRPARISIWRSSLFWQMLSGALISGVIMLLTAVLALGVIQQLVLATNRLQQTTEAVDEMNHFAVDIQSLEQTFELLNDPPYNPHFFVIQDVNIQVQRAKLDVITGSLAEQAPYRDRLAAIKQQFDAISPHLIEINTIAQTDPDAARTTWTQTYAGPMDTLSTAALQLATDLDADARQQQHAVQTIQATTPWIILLLTGIGVLFSILLSTLALNGLARRIIRLSGNLAKLATGDLTPPPGLQASAQRRLANEVVTLEQAYLRTLQTLGTLLARLQADVTRISTSSSEISTAATYQAAGAGEQASAITEVTVTVEELNQTAVQIAEAAASVAAASQQALVSASRGQEAVRDSILGMAMIRSRVNDIISRILALSAQSQRISEIIDVIDEMAARTHILALNAAVESASAGGEAGERFSVVASEVKKLAQRSAAATRDVRTVIAQVQAATNAAVMATEDGLKETEKGVSMAHQSGDANEDIIQMVERTVQLADAISLATQQQRTASEQVVDTMREIAQTTRQTANSSNQAAHAAHELADIADELRQEMAGFQVASTGPPPLDRAPPAPLSGKVPATNS
ncbi:MAG TPA: methyl-accepting chemotaxis protein [Chloroflexia bacterium]|nr:methyl-accepting chemotaxis protein [Chloroflexia bacterium]